MLAAVCVVGVVPAKLFIIVCPEKTEITRDISRKTLLLRKLLYLARLIVSKDQGIGQLGAGHEEEMW